MLSTSFRSSLLLDQSFLRVVSVLGRFRGTQLFLIAENSHPLLLQENPFFKNLGHTSWGKRRGDVEGSSSRALLLMEVAQCFSAAHFAGEYWAPQV